MRLTAVCSYFKKLSHIPGHTRRGKVRLYPYISDLMKKNALEDVMRERENLAILGAPYLSKEEDRGHAVDRRVAIFSAIVESGKERRWLKHVIAEDYLKSLNISKKWE